MECPVTLSVLQERTRISETFSSPNYRMNMVRISMVTELWIYQDDLELTWNVRVISASCSIENSAMLFFFLLFALLSYTFFLK